MRLTFASVVAISPGLPVWGADSSAGNAGGPTAAARQPSSCDPQKYPKTVDDACKDDQGNSDQQAAVAPDASDSNAGMNGMGAKLAGAANAGTAYNAQKSKSCSQAVDACVSACQSNKKILDQCQKHEADADKYNKAAKNNSDVSQESQSIQGQSSDGSPGPGGGSDVAGGGQGGGSGNGGGGGNGTGGGTASTSGGSPSSSSTPASSSANPSSNSNNGMGNLGSMLGMMAMMAAMQNQNNQPPPQPPPSMPGPSGYGDLSGVIRSDGTVNCGVNAAYGYSACDSQLSQACSSVNTMMTSAVCQQFSARYCGVGGYQPVVVTSPTMGCPYPYFAGEVCGNSYFTANSPPAASQVNIVGEGVGTTYCLHAMQISFCSAAVNGQCPSCQMLNSMRDPACTSNPSLCNVMSSGPQMQQQLAMCPNADPLLSVPGAIPGVGAGATVNAGGGTLPNTPATAGLAPPILPASTRSIAALRTSSSEISPQYGPSLFTKASRPAVVRCNSGFFVHCGFERSSQIK